MSSPASSMRKAGKPAGKTTKTHAMQDILLEKLFEEERWKAALSKGCDKDIRKGQLYQLTKPGTRAAIYLAVRDGRYRIAPPHTAKIPKDTPSEFRTVYVNEPVDRVLLSMINDLLFELMPERVHPSCMSYLKGTGCGKVVKEVSRQVITSEGENIGWKSDLSKYFDSVPIRYIDAAFDSVEAKYGPSAVMRLLRDYYHSDWYFDEEGTLRQAYQSLKQGCAPAAWLADVILHDVDEALSGLGFYRRYSDDQLFLGKNWPQALETVKTMLADMDMTINPKKMEILSRDRWFKFLGFSIRGADISLSPSRIKTFQKEIESRTIRDRKASPEKAACRVSRFLYRGNGEHSWATQVLPVINVREDIDTLNTFVMDCLRAVETGRHRLGGLGYNHGGRQGCIERGRGRNVTSNRAKTPGRIAGYLSLGCMRNALLTSRAAYETLMNTL